MTYDSRHHSGLDFIWYVLQTVILPMMTSSNGNIFRVTGPLCGEFTGPGEFLTQRPVTRSFGVFFDLRLNKRLSKQPWGWWCETPSWSLWRLCNAMFNQSKFCCTYVFDVPTITLLQKYLYRQSQYSNTWESKCLAVIAQVVRIFDMNPKIGGSSPPQVESFSFSKSSTLSQEHPFVGRKLMLLPAQS